MLVFVETLREYDSSNQVSIGITPLAKYIVFQLQVQGGIRSRNMSAYYTVTNESTSCQFALHPPYLVGVVVDSASFNHYI